MNTIVDKFNETYPDITVTIQPGNGGAYSEFIKTKDSVGEFPDVMETAREAAQAHSKSLLAQRSEGDLSRIDGKMIFTAEKSGDETAAAVIEEYEDYLSAGIANLVNIFRPEAVILGGGVSAQKEYLTDAVQKKVDQLCFGGRYGQIAPLRDIQPDGSRHPFDQFIIAKTPAARWGTPEDLQGSVLREKRSHGWRCIT